MREGRIAAIQHRAPRGAPAISLRGSYLAPGFIDLHVWGDPPTLSRELVKQGTTAFLRAIGPEPVEAMREHVAQLDQASQTHGACCLGAHLEGPFLNPQRAGALPPRWMRRPTRTQLRVLGRLSGARLMTIAPELPGALQAIRWCRRRRVVASLGHSAADAAAASRAVGAGAQAVTHIFNGMQPFHHRQPALVDVALTDPRLTTMVILDGVHVSPLAFRLLVRAKGTDRVALVTDSIRYQGWHVQRRGGAYYLPARQAGTKDDVLAGSDLTMMQAVRNAVELGKISLLDAVHMASRNPARLLGLDHEMGSIEVGKHADLVIFDRNFQVTMTVVGGNIVYQRAG